MAGIYAWNYTNALTAALGLKFSLTKSGLNVRSAAKKYTVSRYLHVSIGALRRVNAWGKKDGSN